MAAKRNKKKVYWIFNGATFPKKNQTAVIHYVGCLADGTIFDSSRERGKPFKFKVRNGEVIKGWDEGITKFSKGEKATLTCSPDNAYGKQGYPGVIPAYATLTFEIELLDIQ